jgi:hydrogenase maturation protease
MSKPILVIGMGNPLLTDDGIGVKLVEELKKKNEFGKLEFRAESVGGFEILDIIEGYDTVVFIDAIRTENGKAGEVSYLKLEDFKETLHLSNMHDVSFLTAVELGKKLGLSIPGNIFILAIEIVEDLVFSSDLSPPLEARYEGILEEITNWLTMFTEPS